ncbi:response regulator [Idiomarina tyrosinivorans]|uniref:Response regulator n=1 Tax=Idiomarina tyrosinivorans TaxID=1445662 RepID=A0A432ZRF8_9GAMM|nr:DUF3369 domain-containing protein [Idiomarina tyrosinivorans]RUO80479.1 response regulator [Idiomarina tyrosinivorans]
MSSQFMFADEPTANTPNLPDDHWKVMIVDDEPEVHAVTKLALSDFHFLGKGLSFFSAYSGEEAKQLIKEHPDTAIVLLDVVMETDDAGLNVARFIREEANNRFSRIILRTGQPGQAPERTVIVNYDINDYKSKTELTAQKLFTAVMSALRSYRDIMSIDHSRQGLEKIISSAGNLFALQSMNSFVDGLVQQLSWVIGGAQQTFYASNDENQPQGYTVKAAYGDEAEVAKGQRLRSVIPAEALEHLDDVIKNHSVYVGDTFVLAFCRSHCRPQGAVLYIGGLARQLSEDEHHVLHLFAENVQQAQDNVLCLEDADRFLAELADQWMSLSLDHLDEVLAKSRIARIAYHLANQVKSQQPQATACAAMIYQQAEQLIHEVDQRPAAVEALCQQRVSRSLRALANAETVATTIAYRALYERLERWDGLGLPDGKQGEDIALDSQILMVSVQLLDWFSQEEPIAAIKTRLNQERASYYSPEFLDTVISQLETLNAQ